MLSFWVLFLAQKPCCPPNKQPSDIPLKSSLCDLCDLCAMLFLRGAHIAGVSKAKILLLLTVATSR